MVKCYAQEKRVFDISKVTVVGSPTITDDGVASGFKSYNSGDESYLTLPTVFNPQDKPWKIIIKATLGDWIPEKPYCSLMGTGIQGRDNQGVALALGGSNTIHCWFGSTGTSWDIGVIRTNLPYISGKTYYFKVEFTGTKYVLSVSKDRKNWEIKGSIESSTPIYVSAQPLAIGDNKYNNSASTCWTGSIDLMETYVYIGDQVFFNPTKPTYYLERRKEGFDLSKFTVVGTPTITEYGVASGFSGSNYLTIPKEVINSLIGHKWRIDYKFITKPNADRTGHRYLLGTRFDSNTTNPIHLGFFNMNYYWFANLLLSDGSKTINFYNMLNNTNFGSMIGYLEFDGNNYTNAVLQETDTSWKISKVASNLSIAEATEDLKIGYGLTSGSIDLSQFSITVDGKEVFTGAKEKFYAMQGGM